MLAGEPVQQQAGEMVLGEVQGTPREATWAVRTGCRTERQGLGRMPLLRSVDGVLCGSQTKTGVGNSSIKVSVGPVWDLT